MIMYDVIKSAIQKGAKLYGSISGGKDGQAMVKSLHNWGLPVAGLIHADLGRVEWPQSLGMCEAAAEEFSLPLHIVTRADGADMLDHWKNRMHKLEGTGKPFWSSSANRYCTSDLKRDPIDKFLRNCGNDLVISCEGIRAQESDKRALKSPLEIRRRISSSFYDGMTVEEAIANFTPGKRLALTWFPIFNYSLNDVWGTYRMSEEKLQLARWAFNEYGFCPDWWPFHPAYAFGNDRVSCMFCVLGSINDLQNAAKHNPELLEEMVAMEEESGATFKNKWSLQALL